MSSLHLLRLRVFFLFLCIFLSISAVRSFFQTCGFDRSRAHSLRTSLSKVIIAQERAIDLTAELIAQHIDRIDSFPMFPDDSNSFPAIPPKPLVLSFHGFVGTGKSYLASLVANELYPLAYKNNRVLRFHGSRFANSSLVGDYLVTINSNISSLLTACPQSIIIFEEIHWISPDLLDHLIYLFDSHASIDGIDGSQAIYIFTSNLGGLALQKLAYEMEKSHLKPSEISPLLIKEKILNSLKKDSSSSMAISNSNSNNNNNHNTNNHGIHLHALTSRSIVNGFIPFFPLFKFHVRDCILRRISHWIASLKNDKKILQIQIEPSIIQYLLSQLSFHGPVADFGCKGIDDLLSNQFTILLNKQLKLIPDNHSYFNSIGIGNLFHQWNYRDYYGIYSIENNPNYSIQPELTNKIRISLKLRLIEENEMEFMKQLPLIKDENEEESMENNMKNKNNKKSNQIHNNNNDREL